MVFSVTYNLSLNIQSIPMNMLKYPGSYFSSYFKKKKRKKNRILKCLRILKYSEDNVRSYKNISILKYIKYSHEYCNVLGTPYKE